MTKINSNCSRKRLSISSIYYLGFFILSLNESCESILSTHCPRHPEYSAGAGCQMPNACRVESIKVRGGGKEK